MTTTSSRDKRTRRICADAALITLAMALSYLEVLLPLNLLLPLPGFRLGLANVVVLMTFFLLSPVDALLVSGTRILLSGLLFGSVTSLYFSALGGLCAYLMLTVAAYLFRRCSFFGISILCAAAHNCGQILAAVTLFGTSLIFSYLPLLLISSVFFGGAVGLLLNLGMPKISSACGRLLGREGDAG